MTVSVHLWRMGCANAYPYPYLHVVIDSAGHNHYYWEGITPQVNSALCPACSVVARNAAPRNYTV